MRPVPKTMRRAVITEPQRVEIQESEIPELQPDQMLVRVNSAALCTWEQRTFSGVDTWSYPLVGGHEYSGTVVAAGPEVVGGIKVNDRVCVMGLQRCGYCYS
ncbi:MAG: Zn-dependent alcohol dehydrogenase, partial [Chloroflexi bacterium]|nr:Zn-dependent alcohol dehydrogenase [Chloroflexota bacterium]